MRKKVIVDMDGVRWNTCSGPCHETKLITDFYTYKNGKLSAYCKVCDRKMSYEWKKNHRERRKEIVRKSKYRRNIQVAWKDNKRCSSYLGCIAEAVLAKAFGAIERMPYSNPGYDFLCGKGFKVDAKSACLREGGWHFHIKQNKIADYFICLGFLDRDSVEPMRVWVIPGDVVRDKIGINMRANKDRPHMYDVYEYPIDKISNICAIWRLE
jgi:hypothetical protein